MNLDSSFVLPVRRDVSTRLVQMNVLIDMIDPRDRDEVVMFAVGGALFGQLDLVGAIEVIDLADRLPVGGNDIHVFFDLRRVRHSILRS